MNKLNLVLLLLIITFLSFKALDKQEVAPPLITVKAPLSFEVIAAKSFPAVVVIENVQGSDEGSWQVMPKENDMYRKIHDQDNNSGFRTVGTGSGFIIDKGGYIVTNIHVIEDAKFLKVKLYDGRIFDNQVDPSILELIGIDQEADIAVLKINGVDFVVLKFADSDILLPGNIVLAIGSPFGIDYTLTSGIISQIKRHGIFPERTYENYIQTDAAINPGNSGGPLLNINSDVIGVNNFMIRGGAHSMGSIGLGFAISSNIVKRSAEQLIKYGHVHHISIGIKTRDLLNLFVVVENVDPNGQAFKAGLMENDIILSIDNIKCYKSYDIDTVMANYTSNRIIKLSIKRDLVYKDVYIRATVREH